MVIVLMLQMSNRVTRNYPWDVCSWHMASLGETPKSMLFQDLVRPYLLQKCL